MAGAAFLAPVQLESVAKFGSKLICEPRVEGHAGQEIFHHLHFHTPHPITSNTLEVIPNVLGGKKSSLSFYVPLVMIFTNYVYLTAFSVKILLQLRYV